MFTAIPSAKQLEWHEMELGVLIHYCAEIYNPDFKAYKTEAVRTELNPRTFSPKNLNPEQWVRSAYEAGAKYAVLVCNHCTGFSLWQTKVNDYSCASMNWKNGQGDIFREFVDACRKYGLKPGAYYSTGCNGYYNINDEWKHDYKAPYYREYVKNVEAQLTELWSEYGELFEVWFDGGVIPVEEGGPNLMPILEKYQPDAIAFQGPKGYKNAIRWVGNEEGYATDDCWGATNSGYRGYLGEGSSEEEGWCGSPNGHFYCPAETDVPNRTHKAFGGGWAWRAGEEDKVVPTETLMDMYIHSVGRNTNLLLGMAISADGDFQDEQQFIEFGKKLKETFGTPKTAVKNPVFTDNTTAFTAEKEGQYIVIRENIARGQRIRGFKVCVNGAVICEAGSIGHKRIIEQPVAPGDTVALEITAADGAFEIRDIAVY